MSSLREQTGITLVELVLTIVILAIALVGITVVIQSGISRSADTLLQQRTSALAQAYLDEILGKRYDEKTRSRGVPPCRSTAPPARQCTAEANFGFNYTTPVETGENSRSRLDDVDDYHGMVEGFGEARPLQDAEGSTRTGYDNFKVEIEVRYINLGVGEEEQNLSFNNEYNDQYDGKVIKITVTNANLPGDYVYSAYKSNF